MLRRVKAARCSVQVTIFRADATIEPNAMCAYEYLESAKNGLLQPLKSTEIELWHKTLDWSLPGLKLQWLGTPLPSATMLATLGVLKPSFSILRAHHVRRCRNVIVVLSCHAQQLMSRAIPGCRVALQSGCAKSLAARHPKIPQAGRDKNMV